MNSPEPSSRYLISQIFFFLSPSYQNTLTLRLYENTFQFVSCAFKCESAYSSPISHSTSPVSPNSPGIPGLALQDPSKRYYLHQDVIITLDKEKVVTLRSQKPAQQFEFKLLSETRELADAFIKSISDRLEYHRIMMNRLIKVYQTPQIFQVKLQAFQTSKGKTRKGNYFVWLNPSVNALVISKTNQLRPLSLATKFSTIVSLRTVYEQSANFLNGKLIIKSISGFITLHFTPLQHQQLYDLFLALQHLSLIGSHSSLKHHSTYSRADLILRKLKYVARYFFSQKHDDIEDDQIPSQNQYISSTESKKINYYAGTGLKPSSSQGSLTTPFQISIKSSNQQKKQRGLIRNASTANIATPHVKKTPIMQRNRNSLNMTPKSGLVTPNESLTYYFEDTYEKDPNGDFNNSLVPNSLKSYNSMASLPHSKQNIDSKFEKSRSQLIEEISDGWSKISSSRSNQSSQRDILASLIQKINLPTRANTKPVKKILSQIFLKSPVRKSSTKNFLKRDRQSQSQGGLTTVSDKENMKSINQKTNPKSPPLSRIKKPKYTLSTIHQAKSSGREQEEEEEDKLQTATRESKLHNRQSTKFFYYSLDKPPLSTNRRQQSSSTRLREDDLINSSTVLIESKAEDFDLRRQSQVQFFSIAPTLQTFNSQGSLKDIMHIQDYRENSHPVSPSPPKPKLPSKSNQNASPFKFHYPVSRSRVFTANNTQRTKEGNDTYLSTAVTPMNDKSNGRNTYSSEVMQFRFQSRDNDLNEDKENKSPLINSRGHSILELNMQRDHQKDMLDTEAAWLNWSNNSEKGRNKIVESQKQTTIMLEETKAINESANDATESDLRSELQDICGECEETNNYLIDTDRMFSIKQRASTSSLPTVKPYSSSRGGLSSKVARMLNETHAVDPELASLFGTNTSQCKTDRQVSYSLNTSLKDEKSKNTSRFISDIGPPASARNPRIRKPFNFKSYEDSEQDLDQMETERKWRNKTNSFRKSNSVLENSLGSRNNLMRESLTNLNPEPASLQKLRELHILYKEKYLKEKEKMLEMQQAHMNLAHSHQCQAIRIAQLEEEIAQNQGTISKRLKLIEENNQRLQKDLDKEKKKFEAEKKARIRAQAHFDILSTRFRQVEKHLIPKNICLRKNKSSRESASLTRF